MFPRLRMHSSPGGTIFGIIYNFSRCDSGVVPCQTSHCHACSNASDRFEQPQNSTDVLETSPDGASSVTPFPSHSYRLHLSHVTSFSTSCRRASARKDARSIEERCRCSIFRCITTYSNKGTRFEFGVSFINAKKTTEDDDR